MFNEIIDLILLPRTSKKKMESKAKRITEIYSDFESVIQLLHPEENIRNAAQNYVLYRQSKFIDIKLRTLLESEMQDDQKNILLNASFQRSKL